MPASSAPATSPAPAHHPISASAPAPASNPAPAPAIRGSTKIVIKGTVAPDETPPSPDDLPQVSLRETVMVEFATEDRKRHVFVLLDRATGDFLAGGSNAGKPS